MPTRLNEQVNAIKRTKDITRIKGETDMKKDLGAKAALFPMPVLIIAAYDEEGNVNAMNAGLGTVCGRDRIVLMISADHRTTKNILKTGAFTVALADKDTMAVADYFGIVSGNKVPDKFSRSGCHAVKSRYVNAPVISEFPVTMECEYVETIDTENVYAIVGRIVNLSAEEKVLTEDGKIDTSKLNALIFDQFQCTYCIATETVGKACSVGKTVNKAD